MSVPFITKEQMEEINRLLTDEMNISVADTVEVVGKHSAQIVSSLRPEKIIVAYGSGINGAMGLVCARYLHYKGFRVEVFGPSINLKEITEEQLFKLRSLGVKESESIESTEDTVIVDAVFGHTLSRDPEGIHREIINDINLDNAVVVSIDLPSGVDASKGRVYSPYVVADYTIALGLPKVGIEDNFDLVGKIFVVDIGIPNKVYKDVGIEIGDIFEIDSILEL